MKIYIYLFIVILSLLIVGCGEDDPVIPNEEELITTMIYTLTNDGGQVSQFIFRDLDGDGGENPAISADPLIVNSTYTGTIELLDEAESPAESISQEVAEESLDHQFFFETTVPDLVISYMDTDDQGNPLGLRTGLTTGAAGTGTMTIVLRHEPDKGASGVSSGQIGNAGGETDIEVTFNVVVQ